MQPAPYSSVLKDGSCAIRGCEPCQVGNQAALSGLSGVPQGCLSGAGFTVTVHKSIFEFEVYGSIRPTEFNSKNGTVAFLIVPISLINLFGG